MTGVRYVEWNPLRANLVPRAEDWPWSSLGASRAGIATAPRLATDDLLRPGDWTEFVNSPVTDAEVAAIQQSIRRDRPFGSAVWTCTTAKTLGLETSLRPRGGRRRQDANS